MFRSTEPSAARSQSRSARLRRLTQRTADPASLSPFYRDMNERIPLLQPSWQEGPVIRFEAWNAESVYFADPAGNILEFIAHHPLRNGRPGPFSPEDLLSVSEIGLVVPDTKDALDRLAEIDLAPFKPPYDSFAAVGDAYGLFIVVTPGRVWLPTEDVRSVTHPAEVEFIDPQGREVQWPKLPYRLRGISG